MNNIKKLLLIFGILSTIPLSLVFAAYSTDTTISSYVSGFYEFGNPIKAPYFIATSTTATSAFNGPVAIGTTTANSRLTVGLGASDSANGLVLESSMASKDLSARLFWTTSGGNYTAYNNNGTLLFGTGGVPGSSSLATFNLALTAGNNVAIGTSTAVAKLDILNTGTGDSFRVQDSAAPDTSPFVIDANGSVGIGTTTLGSAKLRIDTSNAQSLVINNSSIVNQPALMTFSASDNSSIDIRYNEAAGGKMPADIWEYRAGGVARDQIFTYFSLYPTLAITTGSQRGGIGVGTTTPGAKVAISGWTDDAAGTNLLLISSSTAAYATSTVLRVDSNGDLSTPLMKVSTAGNALCLITGNVHVNAGGTTCVTSSARFKTDIKDLTVGLNTLMKLQPREFTRKEPSPSQPSGKEIGFIAEEVEKVEPRLVEYEADGKTPRGVNYAESVALLTKAIQEQQAQIDLLKKEIQLLKKSNKK